MQMEKEVQERWIFMKPDEIISEVAALCREYGAKEVILYGSRAKGTARERSDIDIAVSVNKSTMIRNW